MPTIARETGSSSGESRPRSAGLTAQLGPQRAGQAGLAEGRELLPDPADGGLRGQVAQDDAQQLEPLEPSQAAVVSCQCSRPTAMRTSSSRVRGVTSSCSSRSHSMPWGWLISSSPATRLVPSTRPSSSAASGWSRR
jgi:hypothetical protein